MIKDIRLSAFAILLSLGLTVACDNLPGDGNQPLDMIQEQTVKGDQDSANPLCKKVRVSREEVLRTLVPIADQNLNDYGFPTISAVKKYKSLASERPSWFSTSKKRKRDRSKQPPAETPLVESNGTSIPVPAPTPVFVVVNSKNYLNTLFSYEESIKEADGNGRDVGFVQWYSDPAGRISDLGQLETVCQ